MNRIRFSCFAFLTAAAVACNKDDVITREEAQAPVIAFDVNTGVYTAKVGREFTIAPTYEYVDRAVYAWKLEKTGRIISTEPVLTYVIDEVEGEEKEDYYIELEVTTPQGTTREQTRVEVYRILPPVIVLSEGAEVVRGHVYEISPDVRWGEKATYRWTMRRPGLPRWRRSGASRLTSSANRRWANTNSACGPRTRTVPTRRASAWR